MFFKKSLVILFALVLVFLGIRPKVDYFYKNLFPASDIGGWCMYQRHVKLQAYFTISFRGETEVVEWKKFLNHGSFASTAHPNFSKDVVFAFVGFIADKHPKVQELKNNREEGEHIVLRFEANKIIEERDTVRILITKEI